MLNEETSLSEMANVAFYQKLTDDYKDVIDNATDPVTLKILNSNKAKMVIDYLEKNTQATNRELSQNLLNSPDPANFNPTLRALQALGILKKADRVAPLKKDMPKPEKIKPEPEPEIEDEPVDVEPEDEPTSFYDKIPAWQKKNTYLPKDPEKGPELPQKDSTIEKQAELEDKYDKVMAEMKRINGLYRAAQGEEKAKHLDDLKQLTASKKDIENQMDKLDTISESDSNYLMEGYDRFLKIAGIRIK